MKTAKGKTGGLVAVIATVGLLAVLSAPTRSLLLPDEDSFGIHEQAPREGYTTVYGWWSNLSQNENEALAEDESVDLRWRIGAVSSGREWAPKQIYLHYTSKTYKLKWIVFKQAPGEHDAFISIESAQYPQMQFECAIYVGAKRTAHQLRKGAANCVA